MFSLVPSSLAIFSLLIVIIFQVNETIRGKNGEMKLLGDLEACLYVSLYVGEL